MPQPPTGLLDTSVVIQLSEIEESVLPNYPTISAITLAELSVGPHAALTPQDRDARQLVVQNVEATFNPLPFDDACARHFALVASSLRRAGSTSRAKAFDALIAATALAHNIPLFTSNPRDFQPIPGLEIHSVPALT